ncbi:MAG: cell division transport system permease protein [Patescibacteria group bacterium]|nr:cell division transport system permease protein [Patescibacteria group bacterium]
MFWITIKRVFKSGWINFRRNGLVSSASVLVTTITLSFITAIFLFNASLSSMIVSLQDKVDIAVYFTVDAPEEKILELKDTLEKTPEVQSVEYVSADEEVLAFRDRHTDDYLTLQALDELGSNPFGGSIRIKAKDSAQYEFIANLLEGDNQIARDNSQIIERINFAQNKVVIERLNTLIASAKKGGLGVTLVLSIISIIIMYTTVRLTIYMSREEIGVMRLVGASSSYVRGPFIVEGVLYGFFAWIATTLLFLPATYVLTRQIGALMPMNLYQYYVSHLLSIGGFVLFVGMLLGALSSYFAARKYLNV